MIAVALLTASLLWALWDEAFGMRPWKAYQHEWKQRYSAFLKSARSKSDASEKEVEGSSDYQKLKQNLDQAGSYPARSRSAEQIGDLSAKILAVQSVFTDRRAYVNALTYQIESNPSSKQSIQKDLDRYKAEKAAVEYPDGSKQQYTFEQLEETYNSLKDQRAKLSAELGDTLKPVTQAKAALDEYVNDHMVDLTPAQIAGLEKKTEDLDPTIQQINVAEANIVDRCESCHMGSREPVKLTAASMSVQGAKSPDDYAKAFVSHPNPALLQVHDPEKFGCSPCHQGNGRATTSIEKAHGNYEHWLWPLYTKQNLEAGCQTCHAADMMLVSGDVGWTISKGKDLFRQRGCMGCHRYEGYDKEPEDLQSLNQQIKQLEGEKRDNTKQSAYLMKQADAAESNDEANKLNDEAVGLRVANSRIDGRLQQIDFRAYSLMQDVKKVGPNLKDARLKLNKNWMPTWLKKPSEFRPGTKMPNFRLTDAQIQRFRRTSGVGLHRPCPTRNPGTPITARELFETRGCLACHPLAKPTICRAARSLRT
jgi:cytochrome c551/c552